MRIGVDLMGSDSSPAVLFEAVCNCTSELTSGDSLVVFSTPEALAGYLDKKNASPFLEFNLSGIDVHLVKETIEMGDDPLSAIRLKKDSSIVAGITLLKEKKIDAFVSAGNTGALIACATLLLEPMPGVERSCLLALLPTQGDPMAMVDVGGSLVSDAHLLVKYAKLGAAYQTCRTAKPMPTVALLNVGVESKKGTREVRGAYEILQEECRRPGAKFHFAGNLEGREVFLGKVDVLVTDGFTGNVMLKTSEGISSFMFDYLQKALIETPTPVVQHLLNQMQRHFSYDEYPGALVCGLEGIVIKCHGAATMRGMMQSIKGAMTLARNHLLDKMRAELSI